MLNTKPFFGELLVIYELTFTAPLPPDRLARKHSFPCQYRRKIEADRCQDSDIGASIHANEFGQEKFEFGQTSLRPVANHRNNWLELNY